MIDIAAVGWGDGPRRALLLHGIGSNKEGWWRVGPALAALGYSVTAIDLRGHGHSSKADRYLLADFASDVDGSGPWDLLLGHSLGGAIAAILASRPGFAEHLVLEDPALFLPDPDVTLPLLTEEYAHPLDADTQRALNPTWHPEDARIKAEALSQCGRDVVEAILRDNGGWNLVADVAGLEIPTLVIGAGIDPITPPALGEGLAALSSMITFVQVPDSSHSIHRDEFEPMMAAVRGWLTGGMGRPDQG